MSEPPLDTIGEAFSRTAARYDAFAEDHAHLTRIRKKVYAHVQRVLPSPARLLELNAGTGTDAVELARLGYSVHATDIAPGMLDRLREKADRLQLHERISLEKRSFLSLTKVPGAPFEAVFSDLGGLNCVNDLRPVISQLPDVLQPGGVVTWVLMPPICLWEMGEMFRGNFRLAFRRLSRGGIRANLEGMSFPVYYFPPRQVRDWFGKDYVLLGLEGLSVLTPTAESKNFAKRYPRLYGLLRWMDDRLSGHWPWHSWGDFYILSLRYEPRK